jgi:hypothetical protein
MNWTLGIGMNQFFVNHEALIEARFPNLYVDFDSTIYNTRDSKYEYPKPELPRGWSMPVLYKGRKQRINACSDLGYAGSGFCEEAKYDFTCDKFANTPDDYFKNATMWKRGYFSNESGVVTGSKTSGSDIELTLRIGVWRGVDDEFFLSGLLEFLDAPGEWAYKDGYVYYWPRTGEDVTKKFTAAKKRFTTIDLSGRAYIEVHDLYTIGGSLQMRNSVSCKVENTHFRHLSHFYFEQDGKDQPILHEYDTLWSTYGNTGSYISGTGNTISHSSFAFSAIHPITLDGYKNTIENCMIHDMGYQSIKAFGVIGKDNVVTKCSIFNAARSCITMGTHVRDGYNTLSYSRLYNSMLFSSDGGTYYTFGAVGWHNQIHHNWWYDMWADLQAAHIYTDQGGVVIHVHHNVFFPQREDQTAGHLFLPLNNMHTPEKDIYHNTLLSDMVEDPNDSYKAHIDGILAKYPAKADDIFNNIFMPVDQWKFTDPANGDFTLKEGSPAIDAGKVVAGKTGTYNGSAPDLGTYNGSAPDLGAYEYGGEHWFPGHTWGEVSWPDFTTFESLSTARKSPVLLRNTSLHACQILKNGLVLSEEVTKAVIMDPRGRTVMTLRPTATSSIAGTHSVRHYPAGMYYVRVKTAYGSQTYHLPVIH